SFTQESGKDTEWPSGAMNGVEAWLWVMVAPRPKGKLWEGTSLAERSLNEAIPRPELLTEHSWSTEGIAFHSLPVILYLWSCSAPESDQRYKITGRGDRSGDLESRVGPRS